MPPLHLSIADDFAAAVIAVSDALRDGGVAIFPTETVYGIGVAAGNAAALARLRRLKGRDADKPFQVLVSGLAMAEDMGAVLDPGARRLAERFWPGPLTLVVPAADGGTLGLRVPDSDFVLAVVKRLGRGILASSANPAGLPAPLDAATADVFPEGVDVLADGGPCRVGTASSVVRCVGGGCEILRAGALAAGEIEAVFRGSA